jgi:uncharacterized protein
MTAHDSPADVHAEWWRRLNAGDLEGMSELYSDDYRSWSPGRGYTTKAETIEFARFFRTLLVDWFTFEEPIVTMEGNRVCTATASHADLKNGNVYNNHYHFLQIIEDGKILETREYNDSMHVFEVVGPELEAHRAELGSAG